MSLPTRLDPDAGKARRDDDTEAFFLAQAARVILTSARGVLTKKQPADMVVELVTTGAFTLKEAWRAVDKIKEQEKC